MYIRLLLLSVFISLVTAFSSDSSSGASSSADPNNCKTPCLSGAPSLDKTTITASTGDTIIMTMNIAGDASQISTSDSYISLQPVSGSGGTLASASGDVIDSGAGTYTVNFVINAGSITGDFYPKIVIGVSGTAVNSVTYLRDSSTSSSNYAFEEHVDGEGSTYTSNGTYVGYVATDIAIPIVTLQ